MRKPFILPLIMFIVFFIIDIILIILIESNNIGMYIFLAAVFLEIAIYGSFIIYEINKHGGNKDD